jgi:hypothetical protein
MRLVAEGRIETRVILSARLQNGARGYRLEAQELALPLGAITGLDQEQEPGCTRSEARGRGGLGAMTTTWR